MDKTRDVRRGASRFSPAKRQINQSGHKLLSGCGGDGVLTEKLKRERVRKLSVVVKASTSYEDREMGCFGSDGDDELRSQEPSPSNSKRFKLPKKFLDNCNSVDHSSVPRKLRSAMKKRNRESISPPLPDLKKLNHTIIGLESTIKKSRPNNKQGSLDGSSRRPNSGPITKEEEEVVETLYALAGMFPNNDITDETKLDGSKLENEFSKGKPTALRNAGDSPTPAFEDSAVLKDNLDSICPSTTAEAANPLSNEEKSLPRETAKVNSLSEPCVLEQPNLAEHKQFSMELDSSAPCVSLQIMPLLSKSEPVDEKPSCNSVYFGAPSELSLETSLKQAKQQEAPLLERKPEIALWPATAVGSQQEQTPTIKDSKTNGPALWPGLSSAGSHGAGIHGPSLQSSAAKAPAWLDTATSATRLGPSERCLSSGMVKVDMKVSGVSVDRKSWKRCAAHVYISHLIQKLQISERKDRLPMQANQLRPNDGLNQEVLREVNNLNELRNGLNGVLLGSIISGSAEKNSDEARNGVLLHKRYHQNQQQPASASGCYTSQKQSFDFLSLSAGGGAMAAKSSTNRAGNGLEQLSQLPVPYLHSLAQHHTFVPFSLPQTCYSTSPYPEQLSSSAAAAAQQVQLQLPSYLGSPFCGPSHTSPPASTKQHQHHQQQQQRVWAAQLAAQYGPGGTSSPMAQFPSWQNGRQDSPLLAQSAQAILPPSSSSLEVLGPKYIPILQQQQQQLMAITSSFPPVSPCIVTKAGPRIKRQQYHHLPSGYEENGGGFHSDGTLQLQLLCNEHL